MRRSVALALVLAMAFPALAELAPPAELPPADYAGQQYVDSKGCLFVRAGQDPGREVWVPRVTREGEPLCGNPPSGRRVPVVEDGKAVAAEPSADLPDENTVDRAALTASGYFVSVGSFGAPANADAAVAKLRALSYPVARGGLSGGSDALVTILAGPFSDAEQAARVLSELKGAGFPDATLVAP